MTAINFNLKQNATGQTLKINSDAVLTGLAGVGLITGIAFQIAGIHQVP